MVKKRKLSKERIREEIKEANRNRKFYLIFIGIFSLMIGLLWGIEHLSLIFWGLVIIAIIFFFMSIYEEYKYQMWKEEL